MQGGDIADTKPALCKEFSNIADHYDLGDVIGDGAYAKVYVATPKSGPFVGQRVAIKVIPKRKKGIVHAIRDEVDIVKEVSHPGIVRILDVRESEMEVFIITELLEGGNLFDRIIGGQVPTERIASNIFRQLLFAVRAVHAKKILHRDLKPQNVLFIDSRPTATIKLIDFGGSTRVVKDVVIDKQVGTVKFMAPEMANKKEYNTQVDMWSLGVILYLMLSGLEPFSGQGTALFAAIRSGKYDFPSPSWDPVSKPARDLVARLLEAKPEKRLTAEEAVVHPWVAREKDKFGSYALPDLRGVVVVKKFIAQPLFVGAIWAVVFISFARRLAATGTTKAPDIFLQNSAATEAGRTTCIKPGRITRTPAAGGNPMRQSRTSYTLTGNNCAVCDRPCDPSNAIRTGDFMYHPGCLLCAACGDHIRSAFIAGPDGQPYHSECIQQPHITNRPELNLCHGCGKQCLSGINALGRVYHDTCFCCRICRMPITDDGNFEEMDGDPHHRSCLQRLHAQEPWRKTAGSLLNTGKNWNEEPPPPPPQSLRASFERSALRSSGGGMPRTVEPIPDCNPANNPAVSHPLNRPVSGAKPTNYHAPMRSAPGTSNGRTQMSARRVSYEEVQPSPDVLQIPSPPSTSGGRDRSPHHLEPLQVSYKSKFCHQCGAKHPNNTSRFCTECGTPRM